MQWWLHVTLQRDFTLLILILRAKAQKWLDQGGAVGGGGVSTVWSPAEGANEYCKLRTQVHSCNLFISLNFTIPPIKGRNRGFLEGALWEAKESWGWPTWQSRQNRGRG